MTQLRACSIFYRSEGTDQWHLWKRNFHFLRPWASRPYWGLLLLFLNEGLPRKSREERNQEREWSSSAQIHLTRIFPFSLRPSVRVGVLPLATEKCLVDISEVSNLNWTYSKMPTTVPDAGNNPGVPSGRERQLPIKRDASFPSDEVAAREMSRPGSILQPHHLPCTWVW